MDLPGRFLLNKYRDATLPPELYMVDVIKTILELGFLWLTWILLIGSGLVIIIITFMCINKLGNEEYPLNVLYQDLKIGAFEEIGKFVISLSIPSILLSTGFSVIGLLNILIFKAFFVGYTLLIVGLVITLIFSYLLYTNTTNLHDAITRFKFNLKYQLIEEIQNLTTEEKDEYKLDRTKKYQTIRNIHDYYEKIDEINDWPFNPKSIRKLTITFFSSILPLIMSLFGFL